MLELPGSRAAEASAYEAAAYTVVDQSDVVIAIWDGGPSGGRGGTTDTVEGAAREGRPLIVIDANGVAPPHLRWHGLDEAIVPTGRMADMPADDARQAACRVLVDALLRPPRARRGRHRPASPPRRRGGEPRPLFRGDGRRRIRSSSVSRC